MDVYANRELFEYFLEKMSNAVNDNLALKDVDCPIKEYMGTLCKIMDAGLLPELDNYARFLLEQHKKPAQTYLSLVSSTESPANH